MKEPYNEGLATHVDPEPCGGVREGAFEALDRGMCRQTVEPRNHAFLGCRRSFRMRKAIPETSLASSRAIVPSGAARPEKSEHIWTVPTELGSSDGSESRTLGRPF